MEVKFRIWDNQQQKFFRPIFDASNGNLDELLISLKGDLIRRRITENGNEILEHESCFPNRFVKSIFTGLKDKNGKEIYLGDVLINPYEKKDEVVFTENGFYGKAKNKNHIVLNPLCDNYLENKEIIGNIYENKDLLKS